MSRVKTVVLWLSLAWVSGSTALTFSSTLVQLNRCTPASTTAACLEYERCKTTHRCGRADEEYDIVTATLKSYGQQFPQGRRSPVALMNDFEDWKTGMHRWSVSSDFAPPTAFGLSTYDFPILGSLEVASGNLIFDTTTARVYGDVNLQGMLVRTTANTTVALFNFLTLYLGDSVAVQLKGNHALVLLSRSSAVVDTPLVAPPGMLGGFPGGGYAGAVNSNGPGSPSVRVYAHTIATSATVVPTVQQIETSAAAGQTLRGTFVLQMRGLNTSEIPFDASAQEVQRIVEDSLAPVHVGLVAVQVVGQQAAGVGRTWRITFVTAAGRVPPLISFSRLTGLGATVRTSVLRAGNQLGGSFQLAFLGQLSPPIAYNILPDDFEALLLGAFNVTSASVQRSDPLDQCGQGGYSGHPSPAAPQWLLPDSPTPAPPLCGSAASSVGGYVWTVVITTTVGNVSPTSPTADAAPAPLDTFVAVTSRGQTPTLLGDGATVTIANGVGFSLAYGGAGGSYGDNGGVGYASPRPTQLYQDETVADLLGGSGGGGGGLTPVAMLPHPRPVLGGAGGGAIYIGAINDVTIGPSGAIVANGAPGENGLFPGGGGSGGSVVLTSGTTAHVLGAISAQGGAGGSSARFPAGGGAGGGGRIRIHAHAHVLASTGALVSRGTVRLDLQTQLQLSHDPFRGAAQTTKSLYLAKHVVEPHPRMEGPAFVFSPARPTRVSYFFMAGRTPQGSLANSRGAVFGTVGTGDVATFVWAIGVVHGRFTYGAGLPTHSQPLQPLHATLVQPFRWYQVDVFMDWTRRALSIRLNGVTVAADVAFVADQLVSVGMYLNDAMQTWWDEVYVGTDHTLQFACPTINAATGEMTVAPRARPLWNTAVLGPATQFSAQVRHASHVSRRSIYQFNNGGLVPNDGPAHRAYFNDIRDTQPYDGSDDARVGIGELFAVAMPPDPSMVAPLPTAPDTQPQATARPLSETQYWYSELQKAAPGGGFVGGIGACSTADGGITWRNEGLMLHYSNLTDPFGNTLGESLLATRPKVLLNPAGQFVLWMHVDNAANQMGLSGVAVGAYPNGPFEFARSLYPSGATEAPGGQPINETHDHTVLSRGQDGFLLQSYYKTVEYWLPRPVMDPLWESVKRPDGSVDFGLSYHRAFFSDAYDNVDDIYLQRFRSEDSNWSISCCNRTTNVCTNAPNVVIANRYCPPQYRKQDPHDPTNNGFRANSVPSHTAWGFQVYNIKTWRGTYFDALSTNVTWLLFETFAGLASAFAVPPSLEVTYPLPGESAAFINVTDPPDVLDLILDTMGVPLPPALVAKYDVFDMAHIDLNGDGKMTLDEVDALEATGASTLGAATYAAFLSDLAVLRQQQLVRLNPNGDGKVTYAEFTGWLGNDPALMFDRFDMDKSGYLDENELSRFFIDRQLPRLDLVSILLDPDFDGRVYYDMFQTFVLNATTVMFAQYDFDRSNSLNASELQLLEADIGIKFLNTAVLGQLVDPRSQLLTFDAYQQWMSAATSLVRDRVQQYKIDNAPVNTRPDRMTGPLHVVEQRRAKYLTVARLSPDFLTTAGVVYEVEGDFDGEGSLVDVAQFFVPELAQLAVTPARPAVPFRQFLAPVDFGHIASYWNGFQWELRPSAPPRFTYGVECQTLTPGSNADCLPCAAQSPYVSPIVLQYQSLVPSLAQCRNDKAIDAYLKQFDQQVSVTLRFQQIAQLTSAGVQPHYSPCVNQTESVPCDVDKSIESGIASPWRLAWDHHSRNVGTSVKVRAGPMQQTTIGQSFSERFPDRLRAPPSTLYVNTTTSPDQFGNVLGGG
ncbi:carbohydrate-binding protein [Achlya hypogyna]|uniref:Carbohydrate-binding protein n=1 Tax=Achlya hypogyna TaxID=1202772 RepID=A0A1V9YPT7_ACHHY|nr:carbohydrate-binding protein [Achlya hypogyna]